MKTNSEIPNCNQCWCKLKIEASPVSKKPGCMMHLQLRGSAGGAWIVVLPGFVGWILWGLLGPTGACLQWTDDLEHGIAGI